MMSDKDNNLLKSDILTVGSELSEKLNAIGVPNTFGKASEGKDNLMSIIRMTINGLDMTIDQIREILRDYYNKSEVNTLLNGKSDTSHNHDSAYANISHNHDNAYASKSHQHDGADVILSNSNDVDTEIGTIENNITSLNNSITNLEIDTGWVEMTPNSSNWQKSTGSGCWYRRKGNTVTVTINVLGTKTFSDNTTICTIPSSIAPTHKLEYGGATNNLTFGGFIGTDGTINIRRPYLGGTGTNWSTSTWVGFSFSYVL